MQTSVSLHAHQTADLVAATAVLRLQWSMQGHLQWSSLPHGSDSDGRVSSPEPAVKRLPLSALDNSESISAALRPLPRSPSANVCSGADTGER